METNGSEPTVPATEATIGKNIAHKADTGSPEGRGCFLAAVILFAIPLLIVVGLANLLGSGLTRLPASEFLQTRMILSMWVLLVCGAVPLVLWNNCWEHEGFCLAVATGALLGLIYGIANGYWISTPFFGACIGALTGYIFYLNKMPACDGWQLPTPPVGARAAAKRIVVATALAYVAFYLIGFVTPTPLIPAEQAEWHKEQLARNAIESRKRVAEAEAANPKGKLNAFKAVVAHFKQFPDRFTPDSQRTAYNEELGKLVREFTEYPFDAKANSSIARSIVELFEAKIENNYTGYQYNLVDECVRNIYSDSLNR